MLLWSQMFLLCCCSVTEFWVPPCNHMDSRTPGPSVLHCLPEFAQIRVC